MKKEFFTFNQRHTLKVLGVCIASSMALSGCNIGFGSDSNSSGSTTNPPAATTTTLSGTVAVGNPLVGAAINLACNGYQLANAATSGNTGTWSAAVPSNSLPCAASASGGTVGVGGSANASTYYSLSNATTGNQTLNITPLTDLALAKAVNDKTGMALAEWLNSAGFQSQLTQVMNQLSTAVSQLLASLGSAGYTVPATFNPFAQLFAAVTTDAYDQLLDKVDTARQTANLSPAMVRSNFATGGTLPAALTPVQVTCLDGLTETSLSGISQFAGQYTLKDSSILVLDAAGLMTHAGKTAQILKLCGPRTSANGDFYLGMHGPTGQSWVALNKLTNVSPVKYTLSGSIAYSSSTEVVEGIRTSTSTSIPTTPTGTTCPTGDNRLTFSSNLAGYVCGMESDTQQNTYNASNGQYFFAGIPMTNPASPTHRAYATALVTVTGTTVTKVVIDSNPGGTNYVCGTGGAIPACSGITLRTYNGNSEFAFTNAVLKKGIGTSDMPDNLTVNGLLIYLPKTPTTTTPSTMFTTTSCTDESFSGYWNKCTGAISSNFTFSNLVKKNTTTACVLSKNGATVSLTVGADTMTAMLDGEAGDKVLLSLNSFVASNSTSSFITADFVNGQPTRIGYMLPGTTIMSTCQ